MMSTENPSKDPSPASQTQTSSHIEWTKPDVVTAGVLKGVPEDKQELYHSFAARDEEWKAYHSAQLLRKVDVRLLPCLILIYLMNFLDRSNLAQARLGSLEQDLGMTGTDFNLATSILFVGYLTMQLPSNLLLTRVRPALYLGLVMAGWGIVSTSQAGVQSFGGLLATRVVLGIMEAPFFPGAIMLMSSWYTRDELTYRIAWFYAGSSLANMFGGLLGAGVLGNLDGAHGIAGWRWLFIIEGSITIGIAICSAFILPNFPANSRWLSSEERSFAEWRLVDDAKEADDSKASGLLAGLLLSLRDWKLYLFVLLQHMSLLSQAFQYFFPSIVKTLGYGPIETLLLTVPVWFATFLVSLLVTFTSGRLHDRSLHIILLMLVACIGNIIATATTRTGPRFFAMFLMPMGAVSAFQIILSWIANSFPRPLVKRSASIAICNMIGNCANIYGSYMYPASAGPQYVPGGTANSVICFLVAVLASGLRLILKRQNRVLEKQEEEAVHLEREEEVREDERAAGFRYVL